MLPSIASVVASNNVCVEIPSNKSYSSENVQGVTYWATMSIQRSRVEIIEELALMVFVSV